MTHTTSNGPLPDATTNDKLDALANAGALRPIGQPLGGGDIADEDELRAIMGGRPNLGSPRATGAGASARRQVRLPESLNTALDDYAAAHNTTPSAVIRDALEAYLASA
ncbi:gamma-glutamyltransferase [Actinomyces sp. zg328]|uniref:gamma-glutamyltransferase n=1 Tax=Actinomyces sp. zg328 TaxID=2609287 RepID=UPI0019163485|nr:gamma-glutamyltransferase [Actinomyces sp. zg328]